jgi:hypothetical protein
MALQCALAWLLLASVAASCTDCFDIEMMTDLSKSQCEAIIF